MIDPSCYTGSQPEQTRWDDLFIMTHYQVGLGILVLYPHPSPAFIPFCFVSW